MIKYLVPLMFLFVACSSYDVEQETYVLTFKVDCNDTSFKVYLRDQHSNVYSSAIDENGMASFSVPAGIYNASLSEVVSDNYFTIVYNASKNGIVVGDMPSGSVDMSVTVTKTQNANPVLIKEVYCGGCQKDDGSGKFANDKCIILYNNSSQAVSLSNMAIGMADPYNAEASSHSFLQGGVLIYESEGWLPGINGIWYFGESAVIEAYSELVVNMCGAIDNTLSYSNSINYANPEYYCMYDPEAASSDGGHYNNVNTYPSPSEQIPTDHYLRAVKYGKSNAWPVSQMSPALFIFSAEGVSPKDYAEDETNLVFPADKQGNIIYASLRVPREWIVDGVEIFNANALPQSKKRMTSDIDNGYVQMTSGYGHAVVRKLDTEASEMAGRDIYVDTNNSTNDFYEADSCSIK